MKYKTLLTRLMTLIKSFQPFGRGPTTERIDSKHSKTTVYYKTGEVQAVFEFFHDKLSEKKISKITVYYKTGEVERVVEYIDGKPSKATYYHKTGEVKDIVYPPFL